MTTTTLHPAETRADRGLNLALWIAQALLAAGFLMSGLMKLAMPIATLSENMGWVSVVPSWLVRFIGVCEFAGGLGLVLPSLTRILPSLTPLAAVGLTFIMAMAAGLHIAREEARMLPINIVLGGLAVFIAWGRTSRVPIAARHRHHRE